MNKNKISLPCQVLSSKRAAAIDFYTTFISLTGVALMVLVLIVIYMHSSAINLSDMGKAGSFVLDQRADLELKQTIMDSLATIAAHESILITALHSNPSVSYLGLPIITESTNGALFEEEFKSAFLSDFVYRYNYLLSKESVIKSINYRTTPYSKKSVFILSNSTIIGYSGKSILSMVDNGVHVGPTTFTDALKDTVGLYSSPTSFDVLQASTQYYPRFSHTFQSYDFSDYSSAISFVKTSVIPTLQNCRDSNNQAQQELGLQANDLSIYSCLDSSSIGTSSFSKSGSVTSVSSRYMIKDVSRCLLGYGLSSSLVEQERFMYAASFTPYDGYSLASQIVACLRNSNTELVCELKFPYEVSNGIVHYEWYAHEEQPMLIINRTSSGSVISFLNGKKVIISGYYAGDAIPDTGLDIFEQYRVWTDRVSKTSSQFTYRDSQNPVASLTPQNSLYLYKNGNSFSLISSSKVSELRSSGVPLKNTGNLLSDLHVVCVEDTSRFMPGDPDLIPAKTRPLGTVALVHPVYLFAVYLGDSSNSIPGAIRIV